MRNFPLLSACVHNIEWALPLIQAHVSFSVVTRPLTFWQPCWGWDHDTSHWSTTDLICEGAMKDPRENTDKDDKQPPTTTSPNMKNMKLSMKDLYEAMGDITEHFFLIWSKLFKRFKKRGGRRHAVFKTNRVNTINTMPPVAPLLPQVAPDNMLTYSNWSPHLN